MTFVDVQPSARARSTTTATAPDVAPGAVPVADPTAAGDRVPAWVATGVVIASLVAVNVVQHLVWKAWWLGPAVAGALLAFARWNGLTWHELGLHRGRHRSGLRWALGVIAVVAVVYLIGVLLPVSRTAFLDVRYHLGVGSALFAAFVTIPVTTILVEEVAFRSVLWAVLSRHATTWRVLAASSALFGLWHILPSRHIASANHGIGDALQGLGVVGAGAAVLVISGIVLFTAMGGVVAGELRRRSGSVIASAGMHWATNSLGVLFGILAWRLVA